MQLTTLITSAVLVTGALGAEVPANVKNFYNSVRARGQCSNKLKSGLQLSDSASDHDNQYSYCGDKSGVVYLQGINGKLADMDIDCDGATKSYIGDTRCDGSLDTQGETSFAHKLQSKYGIKDLNAYVHSYVVFGNTGTKQGYVSFNPRDHGIKPLSVMAVVCGDKMFYGVWGDENGDDGARAAVGEGSIALATMCFGKNNVSGDSGHTEADVLYIAFTGDEALPDSNVNWKTQSAREFERSLANVGDRLVKNL